MRAGDCERDGRSRMHGAEYPQPKRRMNHGWSLARPSRNREELTTDGTDQTDKDSLTDVPFGVKNYTQRI